MTVLAIDPGTTHSGWCYIDVATRRPDNFGKSPNHDLLANLRNGAAHHERVVIEMVASYGMPVGAEVFQTCVWIGRYLEALSVAGIPVELVTRLPVKVHHCHTAKANDATIRRALVDRFAYGQANHGKGTAAAPGWFYGFAADVWSAYALAVYAADITVTDDSQAAQIEAGKRVAAISEQPGVWLGSEAGQ